MAFSLTSSACPSVAEQFRELFGLKGLSRCTVKNDILPTFDLLGGHVGLYKDMEIDKETL